MKNNGRIENLKAALLLKKINNSEWINLTHDFVFNFFSFNDVNQDFSLKYSNNKMGINDVINKLSINNTHANLWH
jgi:hypothetical protein